AILQEEIDQAEASGQFDRAIALLEQAQGMTPEDPWLSYRLAAMLRDQGQDDAAFQAFSVHLQDHRGEPATQHAHALLLASVQRWADARDALQHIPPDALTEPMQALAQRVHENEVLERAQTLYDAGDVSAAMAVLKAEPPLSAGQLRLAEWSAEQGDARQ